MSHIYFITHIKLEVSNRKFFSTVRWPPFWTLGCHWKFLRRAQVEKYCIRKIIGQNYLRTEKLGRKTMVRDSHFRIQQGIHAEGKWTRGPGRQGMGDFNKGPWWGRCWEGWKGGGGSVRYPALGKGRWDWLLFRHRRCSGPGRRRA